MKKRVQLAPSDRVEDSTMDREEEEETLAARRKKLKRKRADAQRADARAMTRAGLSFAEQSTRALPRDVLLRIFAMAT